MSAISDWSTTPANNNSTPPDGAPEGMAPSSVNDVLREMMAQIRTWYEDAAWVDFGYTYTRLAANQFSLSGDYSALHHVGRRVKMSGSATAYGTISAVEYNSPNTVVTLAETTVPSTLDAVAVSVIGADNSPMPYNSTDYARLSAENTFTDSIIINGGGADALQLKAGTSDHVYIEFFADSAALSSRSGYFGYASAGTGSLSLFNEMGGNLILGTETAHNILFDTNGETRATLSSTGAWTLTNGTVSAGIGYSVTPTLQIGTTSSHAVDLYSNGTTRRTIKADGAVVRQVFTVATLPAAVNGGEAFVSDATATTFASIVAGGGSNRVPVYSDGTNWRIG
jgi:hypothetical protein